ncbi:response regulator [bacterium]|nr:response regulator [bacterium]
MSSENEFLESGESAEQRQYFQRVFHRALRKAVLTDLSWRLLVLALVLSVSLVQSFLLSRSFLSLVFVSLVFLSIINILALNRAKSLARLSAFLSLFSLILFSWWVLSLLVGIGSFGFPSWFYLFLLFPLLGFVPVVGVMQEAVYAFLLGVAVFFLLYQQIYVPAFSLMVLGLVSYRNALLLGLESMVSAGSLSLLRMRKDLDEELLRYLAFEGMSLIFRIDRFGIAREGDPSLFCRRTQGVWVASHHTPISEVAPEMLRISGDAGVLNSSDVGQEFALRAREVFGQNGDLLAFYTLLGEGEGKKTRLFFPLNRVFRVIGNTHGFRIGFLYFLIVSQLQQQFRVREQGSHRYREVTQLLEEQRSDLHHVIHLVNNVAQELSADVVAPLSEGAETLPEVRDALQALSAEVSDFRSVRDLTLLLQQRTKETVYLQSFQQSLVRYTAVLARRFGVEVEQDMAELPEGAIFQEDETFALLIARTLIRLLLSQHENGALYRMESTLSDGTEYTFRFIEASRERADRQVRSGAFRRLSSVERRVLTELEALREHLPYLELEGPRNSQKGLTDFSLTFPVTEVQSKAVSVKERWILFVDDNTQILGLYERIAGALEISARTAPSIAGAVDAITEQSAPALVVMDLQLSDGSGEELVTALLEHGIEGVPVLVISGEDVAEFRKLEGLFASRFQRGFTFLSKPVSQQVLIQSLQTALE